ncbi:cement protein, putative [Ixodes scapularis]|uniref:Cement protein, putative n=1 Tax=Ixodes scapularis TaxID=6945 RepID=B7P3U0_IXOSC|nr:cement protein, putative [Ixodes scapularis]|eukprot:XP_002404619.1 cement protein, putative [Ixodes scapularis]
MASHRGTVKLVFSALLALGLCSAQARQSVENRASAYGYGQPGANSGYGGYGRLPQGYGYGGGNQGAGSNSLGQPGANPYAQPGYLGYANSLPGGSYSANPYQGGGSGGAYAQGNPGSSGGGLWGRQGGSRGKRDTQAAYQDSANNLYQDGGARLF